MGTRRDYSQGKVVVKGLERNNQSSFRKTNRQIIGTICFCEKGFLFLE